MAVNPHILLLIGFDRCGSSMISRLLSQHPQVNLLFQPFNSSEISRTQWEFWPPEESHPQTEKFLTGLINGKIDLKYINSEWFYEYSSSKEIREGELNLIKDTKFQFKLKWLRNNCNKIEVYSIWRNPESILLSLVRNDFHQSWYGYVTLEMLRNPVFNLDFLNPYYEIAERNLDEIERMALGIAIRTQAVIEVLPSERWLIYEDIMKRPDEIMNDFVGRYGFQPFPFSKYLNVDYNVAGKILKREDISGILSISQIKTVQEIFNILNQAFKSKLSV